VSAVNGNVSPPRESDFAYTSQFTTAQPGSGNAGVSYGPMALCNKDGKPGQPGNPRVARNEMLAPENKWAGESLKPWQRLLLPRPLVAPCGRG
jgi:hypothetical protein